MTAMTTWKAFQTSDFALRIPIEYARKYQSCAPPKSEIEDEMP